MNIPRQPWMSKQEIDLILKMKKIIITGVTVQDALISYVK
tara:strand:+ start:37815 stop:37934 length:120 start_codon:yes stop_codon:yes gene_type:complete